MSLWKVQPAERLIHAQVENMKVVFSTFGPIFAGSMPEVTVSDSPQLVYDFNNLECSGVGLCICRLVPLVTSRLASVS